MSSTEWVYSNRVRLVAAFLLAIVAGIVGATLHLGAKAALIAWDAGALTYSLWALATLMPINASTTSRLASKEDPSHVPTDLAMIAASILALIGVGVTLADSGEKGSQRNLVVFVAVGSVVASWLLVHTIYSLLYARLYYDKPVGGIDFHDPEAPQFSDFAYMAFTVGMTFQVSDTDISSRRIRRAVLHHAWLSYLFGTVFVATTINLIAGLGH